MTGFEPRIFGFGSDTTTAQFLNEASECVV